MRVTCSSTELSLAHPFRNVTMRSAVGSSNTSRLSVLKRCFTAANVATNTTTIVTVMIAARTCLRNNITASAIYSSRTRSHLRDEFPERPERSQDAAQQTDPGLYVVSTHKENQASHADPEHPHQNGKRRSTLGSGLPLLRILLRDHPPDVRRYPHQRFGEARKWFQLEQAAANQLTEGVPVLWIDPTLPCEVVQDSPLCPCAGSVDSARPF